MLIHTTSSRFIKQRLILIVARAQKPCLDAVAHGGNPQDRAASLANSYPSLSKNIRPKWSSPHQAFRWARECSTRRDMHT